MSDFWETLRDYADTSAHNLGRGYEDVVARLQSPQAAGGGILELLHALGQSGVLPMAKGLPEKPASMGLQALEHVAGYGRAPQPPAGLLGAAYDPAAGLSLSPLRRGFSDPYTLRGSL